MSLLKGALGETLEGAALSELTGPQALALVEALGIAVWCDFDTNEYEDGEFDSAILDLSWSWSAELVTEDDLARIKERAEEVCTDDEIEEAAEAIAETLPDALHPLLYRMLIGVIDADGERSEEEVEMLEVFGVVLELNDEVLEEGEA